MDLASKAAKEALKKFRHGSQISAGCAEIYPAVADALRAAVRAERECCARVALADTSFDMLQDFGMQSHSAQLRQNIADAIRARSNTSR